MKNFAKLKYDNESSSYEKWMHALNYVQSMQAFLRTQKVELKENARILDLGCGTGLATTVLREMYPKAEIVGFDFSKSMLEVCRKKLPDVELVNGDFNRGELRLLKGKFDLIVSTGALSEYSGLEEVLPQLRALLQKDSVLLVLGIIKSPIGWLQSKMWHFKLIGRDGFMKACEQAGFSQVEKVNVPFKFFPTSMMKFVVKSLK